MNLSAPQQADITGHVPADLSVRLPPYREAAADTRTKRQQQPRRGSANTMTAEPNTIIELDTAMTRLTDSELAAIIARTSSVAHHFHDVDMQRVADVFACMCVLAAEQQDRRRELAEHARVQLDGPESGGLLSEENQI